jgi:hypothetical protein
MFWIEWLPSKSSSTDEYNRHLNIIILLLFPLQEDQEKDRLRSIMGFSGGVYNSSTENSNFGLF